MLIWKWRLWRKIFSEKSYMDSFKYFKNDHVSSTWRIWFPEGFIKSFAVTTFDTFVAEVQKLSLSRLWPKTLWFETAKTLHLMGQIRSFWNLLGWVFQLNGLAHNPENWNFGKIFQVMPIRFNWLNKIFYEPWSPNI